MSTTITRQKLLNAFADKPDVADRLARAIDGLGKGRGKDDGTLSATEVKAALALAKGDGFEAAQLRDGFSRLFGPAWQAELARDKAFKQKVGIELGAQSITNRDLLGDLTPLCKDPELAVRDATTPGYAKAAEFVARQLKDAGVQPLGDKVDGRPSYFQAFQWEERFTPGRISQSSNVVGMIPGKGKEPRQAIVVIAHMDNLSGAEKDYYRRREGTDLTRYEGANDNAASVAALLEIARGLKQTGGLERDVVFVVPSAEEEGLKGTEAFVKAPPVPLERMVGCVNLEMIGRNGLDEILVFGGRSELEAQRNPLYGRAMHVGQEAGTPFKPGAQNDDGQGWFERSDHLVLANAGIPSVMFHGRAAPGNYHTPNDTLENLNLDKVRVVAQDALRLVCDLGNDPKPAEKKGPAAAVLNPYQGRVWPGPG